MTAADRKHAAADNAVASVTRAIARTLPAAERQQFNAFLRMLDDDQPRVTLKKSAACGKTEMMLNDLAAAVGRAK